MKNAVDALGALYLMVLELICRERRGKDVFVLDARDVIVMRVVPGPRLFELNGQA